jgi:HPt (histidine-containing phosphotransfer) domain-containing protein
MSASGQPEIAEALKALWQKYLPQIEERVAVIEDANRALRDGSLSEEQRAAAGAAAHKLAGVLGTFGLSEGTNLARDAEQIYTAGFPLDSAASQHLELIAQQLAGLIQKHS